MPIKVGKVCLGAHFLEWTPTDSNPYNYRTIPYPPIHHSTVEPVYIDSEAHDAAVYEEEGFCTDPEPQVGDLVLCRVNAPLVQLAYSLIRSQTPVKIQGRDLGANLEALIKKLVKDTGVPVPVTD